jgi:hypothetical protein
VPLARKILGRDRIDSLAVEVLLRFANQAAHAKAVLRVAREELHAAVEALVEVFEDRGRFVDHEAAVDHRGHPVARVERHELGLARVACLEGQDLHLVGDLLELEREPHAPGVGGTMPVVELDSHRRSPR